MTTASAETLLARLLFECIGEAQRAFAFEGTAQKLLLSNSNNDGFAVARLAVALLAEATAGEDTAFGKLQQALNTFVLRSIIVSATQSREYQVALSEICLQYPPLLSTLLIIIHEGLIETASNMIAEEFVVPPGGMFNRQQRSKVIESTHEHDGRALGLDVHSSFLFLRTLFWASDQNSRDLSHGLLPMLFTFVGTANRDLSQASADALLSLLSFKGEHAINGAALSSTSLSLGSTIQDGIVWTWVSSALVQPVEKYRTLGFTIWLRLLVSGALAFPSYSILASEPYWKFLVQSLTAGSTEQRRLSLSILDMSLSLFHHDFDCSCISFRVNDRKAIKEEYERYNTVYQTIVLGRYLNQVEACLRDLDFFARSDSRLHNAWLVALLGAGMGPAVQESIRKVIGNWVLHRGVAAFGNRCDIVEEFLRTVFLPWAASGPLFNSSIETTSQGRIICTHGDDVSQFLKKLLDAAETSAHRRILTITSLQYLADKGDRVFSFARSYVLDGICQSTTIAGEALSEDSLKMLSRISSSGGVEEIVRDHITVLCASLALVGRQNETDHPELRGLFRSYHRLTDAHAGDEVENSNASAVMQMYTGHEHNFCKLTTTTTFAGSASLSTFSAWLLESQYRCLQGQGLQAACSYLSRAIEISSPEEMGSIDWASIFSAVWEEIEAQDHPRKIVISIPGIILHPTCFYLCQQNPTLTRTLSHVIIKMQALYQFKIYAFPPLVHALRRVMLSISNLPDLGLAEFFLKFARQPPTLKVEFQLESAMAYKLENRLPQRSYEHYYGKRESYGYACVFDTLNRMPMPAYLDIGRRIINEILHTWVDQKLPPPMFSHWKTSSQLHIIIILLERTRQWLSDQEVDDYLDSLFRILTIETTPRLRYLMEWAIVRILAHHPSRRQEILSRLREQDGSVPKLTASIMKIALMLARLPESEEGFVTEFMRQLIPLSASPKIVIRHEAQWTFPVLFQVAKTRYWSDLIDNAAFARLDVHITSLDTYKKPPYGRVRDNFDVLQDHNLTTLFQGEYLRMEPIESEKVSRDEFLALYEEEQRYSSILHAPGETSLPLGNLRIARSSWEVAAVSNDSKKTQGELNTEGSSIPLQTKGTAIQQEVLHGQHVKSRSQNVIVIASLIDNAYNIGGLSRAGEIFGIKSLQVRSLDVIKSKDFTSVAVSSENWLVIEQLELDAIPAFLVQRKLEGYTVVGIEQTDSSHILGQDDWKFPERVVLVLGSEKYGINAALLAEMDSCVEIKQIGVTRSLNVQTAAAVALYEHSRQHPS